MMDEGKVRGHIEGALLVLEVLPGFLYGRINRPDILKKFADAATEAAGREIHTQLREMQEQERKQRSLEELKAFKEVRFV